MKKYTFIFLLLLACTSVGLSQDEVNKTRRFSFKLYGQTMVDAQTGSSSVAFGRFSPAVSFSKDKRYNHEIELSEFSFRGLGGNDVSRTVTHSNVRLVNVGLRYSTNYELFKYNKLSFYLGGGLNARFSSAHYAANQSTSFPYTNTDRGVDVNITPRITWNFSSKFYLDVNVPLNGYSMTWSTVNNDNPLLPVNQRRTTDVNGDVFPNRYTVNVGVGIRF